MGDLPAGGSLRATPLDSRGASYLFGGYDPTQSPLGDLYRLSVSDTTVHVVQLEQEGPPPPTMLHAFVGPASDGSYYLFGGITREGEAGLAISNGLWRLDVEDDVGRWRRVSLDQAPPPRYGFASGLVGDSLLVWGGFGEGSADPALRDPWLIDLVAGRTTRLRVDHGAPPESRRNPQSVYFPAARHLLIWGGASESGRATQDDVVLDLSNSEPRWTRLPEGPPSRASGIAAVLPTDSTVWVGFGNSASAAYQDMTPIYYCTTGGGRHGMAP